MESLLKRLDRIIPFENKIAQERCPNTKRKDLKVCDICEKTCPASAVKADGQVIIDLDGCVECGICSAQCPNEVFLFPRVSDQSILQEIIHSLRTSNTLNIECNGVNGKYVTGKEGHPIKGSIIVPCLASVPEVPILMGYIIGASEFSFGDCPEECGNLRGAAAHRRTKETLELLRETLRIDVSENLPQINIEKLRLVNRRGFMNQFGRAMKEHLSIVALELLSRNTPTRERHEPWQYRRIMLRRIAESLDASTCVIEKAKADFAELIVNENCTLCGVCEHFCPTSALMKKETESHASLDHVFSLCTGCGLCIEVCPVKAVKIADTVDLGKLKVPHQNLIRKNMLTCPKCKTRFIDDSISKLCMTCMKRDALLI